MSCIDVLGDLRRLNQPALIVLPEILMKVVDNELIFADVGKKRHAHAVAARSKIIPGGKKDDSSRRVKVVIPLKIKRVSETGQTETGCVEVYERPACLAAEFIGRDAFEGTCRDGRGTGVP